MINKRLISMVEGVKKYITGNIVFQWISLLANVGMVLSIGWLLQEAFTAGTIRRLPFTAAILAATLLIRYICARLAAGMSYHSSKHVKSVLRERIYKKLLALGMSYNQHAGTAEVIQMAGEGVEQMETYFAKYLPQLFYSLIAPVTLFVILAFVNLPAAIVLLACVPLIPLSIVAISKTAKRIFGKYWGVYTDLGAAFLENLQGMTTLKIYQADAQKQDEMSRAAESFRRITMKVLTMQLGSVTVMDLFAYGGAAAGIIVAVLQYQSGAVDFMGCFAIILLSAEIFIPLRMLGSYFHVAMNGMAACDKIFALLDLPQTKQAKKKKCSGNADVRFDKVSFSYGNEDVLKSVSLDLRPGQLVSIVGESGSGKSTAAALLTGAVEGYRGSITISGIELSEISESSLMKNITLVSSGSHIFKGTVRSNLNMANPKAADEQLWEALRTVRLEGFLRNENGLDTQIQENAANLSGGQRQRLALARALLHDSAVYIFDEATSNIDAQSEELIMETVITLAQKKCVLMVSHRLANVVASDCIYVLKDGRIAEEGQHSDLVNKNGVYAQLYNTQKELESFTPQRKEETVYA